MLARDINRDIVRDFVRPICRANTPHTTIVHGSFLHPDMSFSAGSTRWAWVNGVLTPFASNVPRYGAYESGYSLNGLVIEEARTNYLTYSSTMSNAAWFGVFATATADTTVAPDGTTTADTITTTAGTDGTSRLNNYSVSFVSGQPYALSCYMKAGTANGAIVLDDGGAGIKGYVKATLTGGGSVAVSGTGMTAGIISCGNGWYRVVLMWDSADFDGTEFGIDLQPWTGGADTFGYPSSTNGATVKVWGAQIEKGAEPTTHIPTAGAAVVRNADVAAIFGLDTAAWFPQTEGTIVAQWQSNKFTEAFGYPFSINGSSFANRIEMRRNSSTVVVGNVVYSVTDHEISKNITAGAVTRGAYAYKAGDYGFAINGGAESTATDSDIATGLAAFRVGSLIGDGSFLNGVVSTIVHYPTRKAAVYMPDLSTIV